MSANSGSGILSIKRIRELITSAISNKADLVNGLVPANQLPPSSGLSNTEYTPTPTIAGLWFTTETNSASNGTINGVGVSATGQNGYAVGSDDNFVVSTTNQYAEFSITSLVNNQYVMIGFLDGDPQGEDTFPPECVYGVYIVNVAGTYKYQVGQLVGGGEVTPDPAETFTGYTTGDKLTVEFKDNGAGKGVIRLRKNGTIVNTHTTSADITSGTDAPVRFGMYVTGANDVTCTLSQTPTYTVANSTYYRGAGGNVVVENSDIPADSELKGLIVSGLSSSVYLENGSQIDNGNIIWIDSNNLPVAVSR
jgi:hypothetical protein